MALKIRYEGGLRFVITARGHECTVDVPQSKGGTDAGPTSPELFVGALGTCIGIYVVDYYQRAKLPTEGLALEVEFDTAEDPSRITEIRVRVNLPPGIPEQRLRALQKVAESCLVHQTLLQAPQIEISLVPPGSA